MPTLQLPSKAPRFNQAQIAEILHGGATVTVRRHDERPDPIILLVDQFQARSIAYRMAERAFDKVKKKLVSQEADGGPSFFVHPPDGGRPLVVVGTRFHSVAQIDALEKRRRRELKECIAGRRRALRKPAGIISYYEHGQILAGNLRDLAELPKCTAALKRNAKKHFARIRGIQRRAHYKRFEAAEARALASLRETYASIVDAPIRTAPGALALIKFSGSLLESRVLWYGDIPAVLKRARAFLGKRAQQ